MQLLTQLQFVSATATAVSFHLTPATASHIKPTTASANANIGCQPGATASATTNNGF